MPEDRSNVDGQGRKNRNLEKTIEPNIKIGPKNQHLEFAWNQHQTEKLRNQHPAIENFQFKSAFLNICQKSICQQ